MRLRKPDIMKKEQMMICAPQHVIRVLQSLPNKSEIVSELLLENMDRINGGDIVQAKKAREIELRGYVVEVMQQEDALLQENLHAVSALQETIRKLQDMKGMSEVTKANAISIAREINSLSSKLMDEKALEKLTDNITKRIYEKTETMAKEMFDI